MSKKDTANTKSNASHNYLNTQKSNAHTKVNGNLVQLWFGNVVANVPSIHSLQEAGRKLICIVVGVKPRPLASAISVALLMATTGNLYAADADNDGIDDLTEKSCQSPARIVLNSFYTDNFGTGYTSLLHTHSSIPIGAANIHIGRSSEQVANWSKTNLNGNKDASDSTNGRYLVIDNPTQALIYQQQNIAVTANEPAEFSVSLATLESTFGNPSYAPNIKLRILDANNVVLNEYDSGDMTDEDMWQRVSLSFVSTTPTIIMEILTNNLTAAGNVLGLDSISIANVVCDTDGDGTYDHLDTDSDDDGYSDFDENNAGTDPTDANSVPPTLTYPTGGVGYTETTSNNGSIDNSTPLVITLEGETFTNSGSVLPASAYTVNNVPSGLTPVLTINAAGTQATLTFTGTATAHQNANNVADLTISFVDGAFTGGDASVVGNSGDGTAYSTNIGIDFEDNNAAPIIANQTFSIAENSANSSSVGSVVATDDAAVTNYAITAGNGTGAGAFSIHATTGEITVADMSQLDFEGGTTSYPLTVEVSDAEPLTTSATVTVTVINVVDSPAEYLAIITAYATDDSANPAPTLSDFTSAGVTGVTAGNLVAVQAAIASLVGVDVDTLVEVDAVVAQTIAEAKIEAYANNSSNPAPTVSDYSDAGVTGVSAANLSDVNARVDAVTGTEVDTTAEIQALVDAEVAQTMAEAKIEAYANDNTNPAPSVQDYADAGVTGVTAANLSDVNARVDAVTGAEVDTTVEIQALVDAEVAQTTAEAKIEAYADDNTNPAPTVSDYTDAGVTGVSAANLSDVNARVDAVTGTEVDTTAEIQALVDAEVAQTMAEAKIEAYANDNTNPAPSVQDYADAGVTGVTAANLSDVNARVDAVTGTEVDTTAEIQALVDAEVAQTAAEAKIEAYADDNTNPAPSVQDYADAGVTGVTAANLSDVNARVDAVTGTEVDTTPEIQALVDAEVAQTMAEAKIEAYANDNTNPAPTVSDYTDAGVTGVSAANLSDVNARVDAVTGTEVDTTAEIQALVDAEVAQTAAEAKIEAYADDNTNPAPTVSDYTDAGVTGVSAANLSDVNARVDAVTGTEVDTTAEIQALVDAEVAQTMAEAKIEAYANDNTNPAPSVQDYADAGVTGVSAANLSDVNARVDAVTGTEVDTTAEIQALVDAEVAQTMAEAKIEAYANDNTNPAPSVQDYADAGVTGVTAANLSDVNARVDAVTGAEVDTTVEIQALVDAEVAQTTAEAKIEAYANDNTNPAPSVQDYADAGVTGVSAANLSDVNARVDAVTGTEVDTTAEIQALVDAEVAQTMAEAKIEAYANDNTNPAPSVQDYADAGVTGVTAANLSDVNARVDAVTGAEVDTTVEIQALVDAEVAQTTAEAKIEAYANDNTNPAPSVQDYADAGVTGVTAANLSDVNARVDAVTGTEVDTTAEIQALVDAEVAQTAAEAKIEAYADDNTNPAPTVSDYTDAGVTGVSAANLSDVNARVDAVTGTEVDTTAEIQALVDAEVAQTMAEAKIEAYANDNTNPAPSVQDYADAGVTGVTAANLSDVNARVDAVTGTEVDTTAEIQALVDAEVAQTAAEAKIEAYADDNTNPAPSVQDYADAGVTGVTAANLSDVNARVDAVTGAEVDTTAEIQALVDAEVAQTAAEAKIEAYADDNTNPAPTVSDYTDAGVTGVSAANLSDVNARVDAVTGTDVDTTAEIQALINTEVAHDDGINEVVEDITGNTNTTNVTADQLNAITGVSGAITGTDYTTALVAAKDATPSGYVDPSNPTPAEIQAVVTAVNASNAGLAEVVEDIAGNTNTTNVTADQLNAITGVSGAVTGTDYTTALVAAKDATPSGYVDPSNPTPAEIQAVVTAVNASNAGLAEVVEDIAGNTNTTNVTADQLNAITGVSGAVTGTDYTTALAAAKDATPSGYVDSSDPTPAEIQIIIDAVNVSNTVLVEVAEDIAGNSNNIPVTGTQLNTIIGVSGAIDGIDYLMGLQNGSYADSANPTPAEIQTVVNDINAQNAAITQARDEVVEDIAGNNNDQAVSATQLNLLPGISGAINGLDYSTALPNGDYVDPANPTSLEIQAVIDSVNNVNEVAEDIAGNNNGVSTTVDQLNAIIGVTGAIVGTDYTTALQAAANTNDYVDPANPTASEIQAIINNVNTSNDTLTEVIEDIAGNDNGTPASLDSLIGLDNIDAGTDYTTGLQVGTYVDPAHPTIAEIQAVIDTVNASNSGLAEVIEDIAGNANGSKVTTEQLAAITNLTGIVTGTDYSEELQVGAYADPTHPTVNEIQAVIDKVNTSNDALAEVIEDIAGNANSIKVTPEKLNSIIGVSGAIHGKDYTLAFQTGSYADPSNPTAEEVQAVIDKVNNDLGLGSRPDSSEADISTGLKGGSTGGGMLGLLGLITLLRRKYFKK